MEAKSRQKINSMKGGSSQKEGEKVGKKGKRDRQKVCRRKKE